MKKFKIISVTIAITTVVIGILLYNKLRSEAKSKSDILASIPVSVTTLSEKKLSGFHSFVGTVAANNDVAIVSETQGKITAVRAEVGEYKPAGSTIVEVDNELKQAAFATAEVNYEKTKKDLDRYESLAKQNSATDQQVEATRLAFKSAEAQFILARRQLRDTKITTPISGIITSRPVDVGTYVQSNTLVANVVDVSTLKVKLNVVERDVFKLNVGNVVEVTTDVYPDVKFAGTIRTISAKGDESHTYPVEVSLKNSNDHPLKTGMFARVSFPVFSNNEVLAIPRAALIGGVKNPQVFIVEKDTARLRDVVIGSEAGTSVEVLRGLKQGEVVVINGQNNLKDGVAVTIVK
jgi:RND family efflux transporter MFP subunit